MLCIWQNKYCIVLYCIVLYCIVLYCIVLYCIRPQILFYGEFVHAEDVISTDCCWPTKPTCAISMKKKFFGSKLNYYPNSESCFQLTRIGKSGDISPNPGPTVKERRKLSGRPTWRKVLVLF